MKCSTLLGISWILVVFGVLISNSGWSAPERSNDKTTLLMPSFGAHMGILLPNQIEGVTEILPMWGARFGFPKKNSMVEIGAMHANSQGTTLTNASLSLKGTFPMEGVYGIVFGGADFYYYKGPIDPEYRMVGGGHLGGGLGVEIAEYLHFRGDMKFNVNPGTSMYIGFGFEMLFPQDKEADSEAK